MNLYPIKSTTLITLALVATVSFSSCKDEDDKIEPIASTDQYAAEKTAIKENYAAMVYASYLDSYNEAVELKDAIAAFTTSPTSIAFEACKQKWLDAREPYGQTEAYRFANGPIDDADGPEGALNAWPLDEGYVDYISGAQTSGIINDTVNYASISTTVLENANENGSEKNISIGYHAIEFLLWGQDDANTALMAPGNRPFTDYLTVGGTASNQARRAEYLTVSVDILLADLDKMVKAWTPNSTSNYRADFIASPNSVVLKNILTAMGTLSKSELAGERIFVALNNQDQEDEHSCFSDNTHRDIILNAQGIRNVYTGSYKKVDGSVVSGESIQNLIMKINPTIAEEMDDLSTLTITTTAAIPVPFDYALTQESIGGTGPIMNSVRALQSQGDKISEVATSLGVSISTDLPD